MKAVILAGGLGTRQADVFIKKRKQNFAYLKERLLTCEEFLLLPKAAPESDPSWFGFPLTLKQEAEVTRVDLLNYLNENKIDTRLLFAGNLTRQPYMQGRNFRVSGDLRCTDVVMNDTFWLGVFPGLNENHLDFVADKLEEFFGLGF